MIIQNLLAIILLQPIMSLPTHPPKSMTIKTATISQFMKFCPKFHEYHKLPVNIYTPSNSLMMVRIKNCMDKKDILVISWLGTGNDIDLTFSKLVALHYTENQKNVGTNIKINLVDIKTQKNKKILDKKHKIWYVIYELIN